MFDDLSVRKKLYGGFGAVIAMLLALLLVSYGNFVKLTEANNWDRHSLKVLMEAAGIEAEITDIQSIYRGFLLTGNERYLARLEESEKELARHFQELKKFTADNPGQQEQIKKN